MILLLSLLKRKSRRIEYTKLNALLLLSVHLKLKGICLMPHWDFGETSHVEIGNICMFSFLSFVLMCACLTLRLRETQHWSEKVVQTSPRQSRLMRKLQHWSVPPSSVCFGCPRTVSPIQVISILQRSAAEAKAKSNRECVLIRGMESQAYGTLPPLRGHYRAVVGSRLDFLAALDIRIQH